MMHKKFLSDAGIVCLPLLFSAACVSAQVGAPLVEAQPVLEVPRVEAAESEALSIQQKIEGLKKDLDQLNRHLSDGMTQTEEQKIKYEERISAQKSEIEHLRQELLRLGQEKEKLETTKKQEEAQFAEEKTGLEQKIQVLQEELKSTENKEAPKEEKAREEPKKEKEAAPERWVHGSKAPSSSKSDTSGK